MRVKTLVFEDFVNYQKPSLYIGTAFCGGKCCIEAGIPLSTCHNDTWRGMPTLTMSDDVIIRKYFENDITKAICFAGLEPFEQFEEIQHFIWKLRVSYNCDDDIVIYTGYRKEEIKDQIQELSGFSNIIVKYGRYVPGQSPHYDNILGVYLASDNQYAERI